MGGPLPVTLSDIHMTRTENNVVKPEKPLFNRCFVDDIKSRRKKNEHHIIFENLNKFHPKINLTIEVNPCRFLDTKIINNKDNKDNITTEVFCKTSKLPVHWSSRVPKRYKRNAVIGDLHRSKRISSTFEMVIKVIKRKFRNADYPLKFLTSVMHQFLTPKNTTSLLFHLIFLKRANHLVWLKCPIVKKTKTFLNIVLRNWDIYQSPL